MLDYARWILLYLILAVPKNNIEPSSFAQIQNIIIKNIALAFILLSIWSLLNTITQMFTDQWNITYVNAMTRVWRWLKAIYIYIYSIDACLLASELKAFTYQINRRPNQYIQDFLLIHAWLWAVSSASFMSWNRFINIQRSTSCWYDRACNQESNPGLHLI